MFLKKKKEYLRRKQNIHKNALDIEKERSGHLQSSLEDLSKQFEKLLWKKGKLLTKRMPA
ncbi:CLUMA_CG002769, isoform A [Clunio marinus]|uniref:CLUMA_CG002769, isoform A n=1 Tax=Clunio marinus TaxID=568069 RepID=A0A1J1HNJ9_9DIPT|nr:CLUMA_CG002769, isoform A [Clunio marinus]